MYSLKRWPAKPHSRAAAGHAALSCGSGAKPHSRAAAALLVVRRVLHVFLDVVLGVPRVLLRVAHLALRMALRLLRAAVRMQRVLRAVRHVGGVVLDVLRGIALRD